MPVVVRTWNLFHGNAHPPERRAFLREMVELVTADEPDVVCLQEVPLWGAFELDAWSGMDVFGTTAAPPRLGSIELGRVITALHHGLFRSAFTGQANAMLFSRRLRASDRMSMVISTDGERRVCQALRIEGVALVANVHVTGGPPAADQLQRAVDFVERVARPDEPLVFCGDFNLRPPYDFAGWSEPLTGSIDQILVRGAPSTPPVAWPEERRHIAGRVVSDHAPVELTLG